MVTNKTTFRVNATGVPWSDCGVGSASLARIAGSADAALEHAGFDGVVRGKVASRHGKAASKPPPLQGASRNQVL